MPESSHDSKRRPSGERSTALMSVPSEPAGQMPMTGNPSTLVHVAHVWSRWLARLQHARRLSKKRVSYAWSMDMTTEQSAAQSMLRTVELCPESRQLFV